MKTLSKILENYAEVNRKIGFYGYDGERSRVKRVLTFVVEVNSGYVNLKL